MNPSSAAAPAIPLEDAPDRLVLLPGGEAERAPHPAGHGRTTAYGLPPGHVDASLLLLIGEAEGHGYDLLSRIGDLGVEWTDTGALYRRLRRLERDGLVRSRWEHAPSGPPRRTYSLTAEGGARMEAYAEGAHRARRQLSTFLHRYRVAQLE